MKIEETVTKIRLPILLWREFREKAKKEKRDVNDMLKEVIIKWLAQKETFDQKQEPKEKVDIFGNVSKMPSAVPENTN